MYKSNNLNNNQLNNTYNLDSNFLENITKQITNNIKNNLAQSVFSNLIDYNNANNKKLIIFNNFEPEKYNKINLSKNMNKFYHNDRIEFSLKKRKENIDNFVRKFRSNNNKYNSNNNIIYSKNKEKNITKTIRNDNELAYNKNLEIKKLEQMPDKSIYTKNDSDIIKDSKNNNIDNKNITNINDNNNIIVSADNNINRKNAIKDNLKQLLLDQCFYIKYTAFNYEVNKDFFDLIEMEPFGNCFYCCI